MSYNERTDGLSRSAALLTNGLQELLAEHYSVELSEKTHAGWPKRAEKGLPAGDIPFGYASGGSSGPPVVVAEETEALRGAYERYAVGDASLMDIASYLNAQGLAPRSKHGSPLFGQKTVHGMLANPFYIGDIVYKGEVVAAGLHEPVISRELFQRVQAVREKRRSAPQGSDRQRYEPHLPVARCRDVRRLRWLDVGQFDGERTALLLPLRVSYARSSLQRGIDVCPCGWRGALRADAVRTVATTGGLGAAH